jgi:hypothetical protein
VERDVLRRLPPSTLDYLAITGCDDGAMGDSSVRPDPDDPTMVRVESMTRQTALESKGWVGFCSAQL